MRYLIPSLLVAATSLSSAPVDAQGLQPYTWEIEVDSYGAIPNDGLDDGDAIQDAFDAAVQLPGVVHVIFASGRYLVENQHIGTAPSLLKYTGYAADEFTIRGASDGSSEIVLLDDEMYTNTNGQTWYLKGFLWMEVCSNLTVKDLTVDYLFSSVTYPLSECVPSLSTQGKIFEVGSNYTIFDVDPGYRAPLVQSSFGQVYAQTRVLDGSGNLKPEIWNRRISSIEVVDLASRRYRLNHQVVGPLGNGDAAAPNDTIVVPNPQQLGATPAFRFLQVADLTLDEVIAHGSPTQAFLVTGCTDISMTGVEVTTGAAPSPVSGSAPARLFSSNRDGIHMAAPRGVVNVTGCDVRYNGDDAITIHQLTLEVDDANGAVVTLLTNSSFESNTPNVGDAMRLYDSHTNTSPTFSVDAVTPAYQGSDGRFRVDVTISPAITLSKGDEVQNLGQSGDSIVVTGNLCEHILGRGIKVHFGSSSISGNTTRYTHGPGINFLSNLGYTNPNGITQQLGGGFASQVSIVGNVIEHPHVAEGGFDVMRGGISLYHHAGPAAYQAPDIFDNFLIRSNTIRSSHGVSLVITNATGVNVYNNTFDMPDVEGAGVFTGGIDNTNLVYVEQVDDIDFQNNRITNSSIPVGTPPAALVSTGLPVNNLNLPPSAFTIIP